MGAPAAAMRWVDLMHAVRVIVICDELLRIEYSPSGRFCDDPSLFATHGPAGSGDHPARAVHTVSANAGGRGIVVETPRVRFEYQPDGRPPHAGNMHASIAHPAPPPGIAMRNARVLWTPGAENKFNLGGTLETLDGVRGSVDTGSGLLARDGWSLIDDSSSHLLANGWALSRESAGLSGNTDWYLFAYGADYGAALSAFAMIAGRVPMPRRAALGSWYSRYWPYTSDEFRGIVLEYRTHGFPLDVMVLDMDWHKDGWTGWSWNRTLIPDPEQLLEWLHEEGLAVTLNLHPADGVGPHEDRYGPFMRALGREPSGQVVPFDAGDRAYMNALFEQVHVPLESPNPGGQRAGVDFWWVDWQQDRYTRSIPGLTNLRWLNHLYFQHTSREKSRRGMSFSRWGGWGDHRYPIHFSGDAHTGWPMLAFQVPFTVQAGNVGCFFWSHDIGGHFGPRLEETTARWMQFGALSAALRLHSARSGMLDRRPWTYEPRFAQSMRRSFELRCRLMPYIVTAVRECFDRTLPLLRPAYLACACDQRAYETPSQYLLGNDVLVAPIVTPGVGERCIATQRVWFPCGCVPAGQDETPGNSAEPESESGWFDLTTGEHFSAGDEVIVASDIDHIPVFVRAGVPIPMQPVLQHMCGPVESLVVRLFPGTAGERFERELYEDDGVSQGYLEKEHARTAITAAWSAADSDEEGERLELELTIAPTIGAFNTQPSARTLRVEIGSVAWVGEATVDGESVRVEHDPELSGGLASVDLGPPSDIRIARVVRIVLEPANRAAITERIRRTNLCASHGTPLLGGVLRHVVVNAWAQAAADDPRARTQALAIGGGIAVTTIDGHARFIDSLAIIDDGAVEFSVLDVVGGTEHTLQQFAHLLRGKAGARAFTIEIPSDPLPAAPLGVRATRLIRASFRIDGVPISFDSPVRTALAPLSKWAVAAPFDWDWRWNIDEHQNDPERAPLDARAIYRGADNRRVGWMPAQPGDRWQVDFTRTSPDRRALGYAWTRVHSEREQDARLYVSAAGDKTQVFLNGALVFNQNGFDSDAAALEWIDVALHEGMNTLLVKAAEGGGGWGVTLALECERPLRESSPLENASPAVR